MSDKLIKYSDQALTDLKKRRSKVKDLISHYSRELNSINSAINAIVETKSDRLPKSWKERILTCLYQLHDYQSVHKIAVWIKSKDDNLTLDNIKPVMRVIIHRMVKEGELDKIGEKFNTHYGLISWRENETH